MVAVGIRNLVGLVVLVVVVAHVVTDFMAEGVGAQSTLYCGHAHHQISEGP